MPQQAGHRDIIQSHQSVVVSSSGLSRAREHTKDDHGHGTLGHVEKERAGPFAPSTRPTLVAAMF